MRLKVGELARRTGLTVRTLHYYDEIGLLSPSHRTEAGYRLYGEGDVARLQQIVSLKQLGLSLEAIRECMARPEFSLRRVLELHIVHLRERIELQQGVCRRLEAAAERLDSAEGVSVEEFLRTIEAITMFEKYYTPEQLREIEERGREIGPERIREVEAEWPKLIAEVRAEMERGSDPASEPVRRLARRWRELVNEFTRGNPEIERSLRTMYREEPGARERGGVDPALFEYVSKALAAAGEPG